MPRCRYQLVLKGGLIELEHVDSANPPLAVDRLYGGRYRQRRRPGAGEQAVWVGLLALLPLVLLLLTGLYLFVLPYAAKWRSGATDERER